MAKNRLVKLRDPSSETKKLFRNIAGPVVKWLKVKQQKQKTYFDRKSRDLGILEEGDVVRLKPFAMRDKAWKKGTVLKRLDERSYEVETGGQVLRRNRVHIRKTAEKPDNVMDDKVRTPMKQTHSPDSVVLCSSPTNVDNSSKSETDTPSVTPMMQRTRSGRPVNIPKRFGCGTLFILELFQDRLVPVRSFDWTDGLFDIAWAENNENVIVTAAGDGSLLVYDVNQQQGPLKVLKEHSKEINSVDWSLTRGENLIVTGSWDASIKVWDIQATQSLLTFTGHEYIVYAAVWSPHMPGCFASASGDHTLRVWDARKPRFPTCVVPAHDAEILTCDWVKYDQNAIFTGSVDGLIRGWDLRKPMQPMVELKGHQYAVRRIKTSPFMSSKLASCSYDFSTRIWDYGQPNAVEVIEHHTEFVYGLDFNLHIPGQIADCGWDELLHVYQPASCIPAPGGGF